MTYTLWAIHNWLRALIWQTGYAAQDPVSIVALAAYVIILVSYAGILNKTSGKPWACLIPFYGDLLLVRAARCAPWWVLVLNAGWILEIAGIPNGGWLSFVAQIVVATRLLERFRKHGTGWFLGVIFLPIVFLPILAFGKAEYTVPYAERKRTRNCP